ncbi:putative Mg2+ transporter-C (MgtC) family protein [Alkalicoccobacillus murimartini]|uniref:Mg2+ transporter-C (MgtC) family protein n=2 Tax=Alkalicoccobacillus murimartini TaxID=171685 RepID=A0ABT9YKZ7_9BACI|nr:putative Mg2+ transporter-C (MgtC) family protein [Alkalicoccobacillus murimartini]
MYRQNVEVIYMDILLIKLIASLISGFLIGVDRQIKHKPLGLKTSMVICIASCLMTIVSIEAVAKYASEHTPNMDPMRLAAQVVSGVGFLGAGVILRRSNDVISGLTTAAMIWAASGLGIAIGAGFYVEATFAVILILMAINVIPAIFTAVGPSSLSSKDIHTRIVVAPEGQMSKIIDALQVRGKTMKEKRNKQLTVRDVQISDLASGNQQMDITLSIPKTMYITDVYYLIKDIDHVQTVDVEKR